MIGMSEEELRIKLDDEVLHLQNVIKGKDKELVDYKKEHGRLTNFFRQLDAATIPLKPLPIEYKPRTGKRKISTKCAAVMHSTDGHHGAIQPADEIEGFNEFSPEISTKRQLGFARDVVEWVELHRNAYNIDELCHLVTGDMINGTIQRGDVTNAWPAPVQAIRAGELLAQQISITAPHFKEVNVHFIVEDNHSRLTAKPQSREAGMNSMNYVVGSHAKALLADFKNVNFNIYPMHEKVIHVAGRSYLISHGHGIKSFSGYPWYGIERKVGREATARLQLIMDDIAMAQKVGFQRFVFGHFHTPVNTPLYTCSGSVQGTTAYDHQAGRYAKPSQSVWLVHPKFGEFDWSSLSLRDK